MLTQLRWAVWKIEIPSKEVGSKYHVRYKINSSVAVDQKANVGKTISAVQEKQTPHCSACPIARSKNPAKPNQRGKQGRAEPKLHPFFCRLFLLR